MIADTDNHRVRVVAEKHRDVLRAGDDGRGHLHRGGYRHGGVSGDGGPASGAELNNPSGVALDGAGNLVIADQDNGRVRLIAASTGTFYGKAMTAGDIYTVAGHGSPDAAATAARPPRPSSRRPSRIRVDGAGDLVIADPDGRRSGSCPAAPAPCSAGR